MFVIFGVWLLKRRMSVCVGGGMGRAGEEALKSKEEKVDCLSSVLCY